MPTCKAVGCKNSTGKVKGKKSFFMIPKPKNPEEKLRCLRWIHNIRRAGMNISNANFGKDCVLCEDHFHLDCCVLCEDHFHLDCIKRELVNPVTELGGKRRKKELKPGAVPTIFAHRTYDEINMDGTEVLQRSSSLQRSKSADRFLSKFILLQILKFNI